MRWRCVPACLAGWMIVGGAMVADGLAAQGAGVTRSDISTVFGYYGVTDANTSRRFATAWGNTYLDNGLGAHVEAHFMDREEIAEYFAGGLSWNGAFSEVRGWLGTSTDNAGILPEFHARLEATYRTRPELGLVFSPALSHRRFRNDAEEMAAELQVAKYAPIQSGSLIWSVLGRATFTDPGNHLSAAFGIGLTYAQYRKFSIGLTAEGGRAAYDGLLGPGMLDERYFSIRPHASLYVTENVELFGMMEYSGRESYSLFGGHIGLKIYLDGTAISR